MSVTGEVVRPAHHMRHWIEGKSWKAGAMSGAEHAREQVGLASRAGMIFFARGDKRIQRALALKYMHGQTYRAIGREIGVNHVTVRNWCESFAAAGKDVCRLEGITAEGLAQGTAPSQSAA